MTPWTVAHQTPLSMGFPRQDYQSELPFPPPVGLPDPETKPAPPALLVESLPLNCREALVYVCKWSNTYFHNFCKIAMWRIAVRGLEMEF